MQRLEINRGKHVVHNLDPNAYILLAICNNKINMPRHTRWPLHSLSYQTVGLPEDSLLTHLQHAEPHTTAPTLLHHLITSLSPHKPYACSQPGARHTMGLWPLTEHPEPLDWRTHVPAQPLQRAWQRVCAQPPAHWL